MTSPSNASSNLKAIIVTHGGVAQALLDVIEHIVGPVAGLAAVGIGWDEEPEAAIRKIEQAIELHGQGCDLLVLTDMFGGTSTNVGLSFLDRGRIELVTGVNLPMLVKLASVLSQPRSSGEEGSLSRLAAALREQGRRSIEVASELIQRR